jgi:hypothetical protein
MRSNIARVSTPSPAKAESQLPKVRFRGQDHRAAFIAFPDDLEEEVGLLTAHRQIADLIDDQQSGRRSPRDASPIATLTLAASSISFAVLKKRVL